MPKKIVTFKEVTVLGIRNEAPMWEWGKPDMVLVLSNGERVHVSLRVAATYKVGSLYKYE